MKNLIIIPAYNEQESIEKTVEDIKANARDLIILWSTTARKTIRERSAEKRNTMLSICRLILELAVQYRLDTGMPGRTAMKQLCRWTATDSTIRSSWK